MKMRIKFQIKGHKNIKATHKTTIEFTKDNFLTQKGDCIIGVFSNFSLNKIKDMINEMKKHKITIIKITIISKNKKRKDNVFDTIIGEINERFDSNREIVIRKSDFISKRTLIINANKSSNELRRELINEIKEYGADVILEPIIIKAFVFDFDDTLEDYKHIKEKTHKKIASILSKRYKIGKQKIIKNLDDIDFEFSRKGVSSTPKIFNRKIWFKELYKRLNLKINKKEIKEVVGIYWGYMNNNAKEMPHARQTLKKLKQKYKIIIISDSDGKKKTKLDRIKKIGLLNYVDYVITSDDTNINKPSRKFFEIINKKLRINIENVVVVGDKPEVDLYLPKQMGAITIWIPYGAWSEHEKKTKFWYIDYKINDLKNILNLKII